MKDSIILYPALDRGHLMSTVELGKLIATQHPSISVNILILTPPTATCSATHNYLSAVSAAASSITFHHLPPIPLPPTLPPQAITLELCRHSNNNFRHVINSISQTSNLKAIVLDFMNYTATQVTQTLTLNIPTYFYYTSGASTLAVFLQLPILHETTPKSIKDLHTFLRIPGLPKIHTTELPDAVQDRSSVVYQVYMDMATSMRDSDGVIINSCDAIEGRAISALSNGLCLPEGTTPKVFGVGPVISTTPPCGDRDDDQSGCLSWLDSQPSQSVVFLCFGSLGTFSKAQLKEIAVGLEKSKQRFIWVLRSESIGVYDSEQSLDELLPEGFLERTKEKGLVVRNWAPQAAILSHDSVGGFVTHCGWNSVLEAVCEGVPMVAWPLYAEQKLNRAIMVNEMKVALGVNESKDGLVSGTELEERVKELMDSDKGKEIRQRIFKMKIGAKEAREEGGSSHLALNRLAQLWEQYNSDESQY